MAKAEELLKQLTSKLGLAEDTSEKLISDELKIDDVDKEIKTNFIARKLASEDAEIRAEVTGKVIGPVNVALKRSFGLEKSDIEDKKWEDILEMGVKKLTTEIDKLKEESNSDDVDEQVKKLTEERDSIKTKLEEADKQGMDLNKKLEDKQGEFDNKIKEFKISSLLKDAKSKVISDFPDTIKPLEKEGYDYHISSNYKFDLNENGDGLVPLDKDGNKVKNDKETELTTVDELLTKVAVDKGLLKMTTGTSDPKPKTVTPPTPSGGGEDKEIKLHPNTVKNTERLEEAEK